KLPLSSSNGLVLTSPPNFALAWVEQSGALAITDHAHENGLDEVHDPERRAFQSCCQAYQVSNVVTTAT
ncbi:hypothetical protein, partial [Mycolicibacterium vulneris]|uniref:hypothetical protein n=1 Tax=Mycolicibacterium vulneris TaxID=547163 RepID=UPI001C65BB45